jgi:hypothetical protein
MLASTVQFSRNGQHHSRLPARKDGHGLQLKTRAEARFLRTQQRAHPGPRPATPVPRPEGNVLAGKRRKDPGE